MLSVVVQAGGQSRRMGTDKGLVPFNGRPLIERVISRVSGIADELLVITNHPEDYAFLNLPLYVDKIPDRGALGGLYTALAVSVFPVTAVVACDMPFVSQNLLREELRLLEEKEVDAVIPRAAEGMEPFHAVYRRAVCLPLVEKALKADLWKVNSWFCEANIYFMDADEVSRVDRDGLVFMNANTPQDLAAAERLAAERG